MNPRERRVRRVQTFIRGPWFMVPLMILTMVMLHLDTETVMLFNKVMLTLLYLLSMVEMVLKVWPARGLRRQEDYLRDSWNMLNVVILGAETLSYDLCVFGADWGLACILTTIRGINRIDESVLISLWNCFPYIVIVIAFNVIIL